MPFAFTRRVFLAGLSVPWIEPLAGARALPAQNTSAAPIRVSCNLYSFNEPLTSGAMTIDDVLEYCASVGFDAVDPTGYYFRGYPDPPPDQVVHHVKQRAFRLGLDISGTGVRNDFSVADPQRRHDDVALVTRWIPVAAKLGAPLLRVFAGRAVPDGFSLDQVRRWVVESLSVCVEEASRSGVMIALQNHDDAFKTAEQVLEIRRAIASEWFGLLVDIGSLRTADPYEEIEKLAPHAVSWQIKESVYRQGREEKTDVRQIVAIVRRAGYRGYLPLETLGAGDPKDKLRRLYDEMRTAIG
jgi:sugar phosphate isomerase/epimerase